MVTPAAAGRKRQRQRSLPDASAASPVPSVEVGGIRYLSDRFYLNLPTGLEGVGVGAGGGIGGGGGLGAHAPAACTCGSTSPPPLLDRAALVRSLLGGGSAGNGGGGLVAAILSTYTFDPGWMAHEMPGLFPLLAPGSGGEGESGGGVPTLVLHGHRGLRLGGGGGTADAGDGLTRSDTGSDTGADTEGEDGARVKGEDGTPPEEGWRRRKEDDGKRRPEEVAPPFAASVHVTEVLPAFVPPPRGDRSNGAVPPAGSGRAGPSRRASAVGTGIVTAASPVALDDSDGDEGLDCGGGGTGGGRNDVIVLDGTSDDEGGAGCPSAHPSPPAAQSDPDCDAGSGIGSGSGFIEPALCVDRGTARRRRVRAGVHHPKFMLLFERSGSVVVLVTTSNLTRTGACEGTWLQRFGPSFGGGGRNRTKLRRSHRSGAPSDFGTVLADFLRRQSDAAEEGAMTPDGFVRRYLEYPCGLDDLEGRYAFEEAQVHLVPTVPGDHRGRHTAATDGAGRVRLFGPQRIADVVARIRRGEGDGRGGSLYLAPFGRLLLQSTSFGGRWSGKNFDDVARSYMGSDDRSKNATRENAGQDISPGSGARDIADSVDIVWPSQRYLDDVSTMQAKRRRLKDVDAVGQTSDPVDDCRGHFCFFPTQSFNTSDLSVISRMVQFENAVPSQLPWPISPHIKSVALLLDRNVASNRFEDAFAWFLLTSACFSRGAQGEATFMRGFDSDEMSYSNFELGVLFCSSLMENEYANVGNRLYGFRPRTCECRGGSGTTRNIHLPVPYRLRPPPYQADEEDVEFVETPYFHELTQGVGGSGQMGLTPLGRTLNAKAS